MRKPLFVLALLGGAILSAPALARPCTSADVAGLWELRSITAAEPGVQAFYKRAPHEYLSITPAMNFAYAAGSRKLKPDEAERVVATTNQVGGHNFTLDIPQPGRLFVLRNAQEPFQGFTCEIADAAQADVAKGDMVWTELPGTPALKRVHRQLKPPVAAPFFLLGADAMHMHGMDTRTVKRTRGSVAFDLNIAHGRPKTGGPDYATLRVEADCATRKYRVVSIQNFSARGAPAGPPDQQATAWASADAGPIAEALTLACTGKPSVKQTIPLPSLERAIFGYRAMLNSGQLK